MTSQNWEAKTTTHILSNISRSKDIQAMKFGQLIEYSKRKYFSKKHTQNMMEKLFLGPFVKSKNSAYLWINSLWVYTVCSNSMPTWGLSKNTLKLSCRPFAFNSNEAFRKSKWSLELVSLSHFLQNFWRKIFFFIYLTNWPNFIIWPLLFCEILSKLCIIIVC